MESYDRICNCRAWRKLHLLPTYCKLTLWPASASAWEQTLPSPSTVPCLCNSILTQFFVKVSQTARQGRQHILQNHRDSPSQAHAQPHGKGLGWCWQSWGLLQHHQESPREGLSLEMEIQPSFPLWTVALGHTEKKWVDWILSGLLKAQWIYFTKRYLEPKSFIATFSMKHFPFSHWNQVKSISLKEWFLETLLRMCCSRWASEHMHHSPTIQPSFCFIF